MLCRCYIFLLVAEGVNVDVAGGGWFLVAEALLDDVQSFLSF